MTPSVKRASDRAEDLKPLQRLFARAKRRAWLLIGIQSASHALILTVFCAAILAPTRSFFRFSISSYSFAIALIALALTIILTFHRRMRVPEYLRRLDDRFDAAGRIVSAAEFLDSPQSRGPFHELALTETATWIAKRPAVRLPWTWPTRWAALSLAFALLASTGCQKPQPVAVQSRAVRPDGKIKVEQPDPGDHHAAQSRPPPTDASVSAGSNGMFGQPAERPSGVTYGSQQLQADRGIAQAGNSNSSNGSTANRGAAQGTAKSNSENNLFNPSASNGGAGAEVGNSGPNPAAPSQKPGKSPPNAPPGGSLAGRGPGQKQPDPRGVSAARKDVAATAKRGEGKSSDANKPSSDRKPGSEFAQGGPSTATQPAANSSYDGVELDELAIERLPPEQRERIRQYNANLRKLRQTTQPHGS